MRFITTHGLWRSVALEASWVLGFSSSTLFSGVLIFKFGNDSVTAAAICASISGTDGACFFTFSMSPRDFVRMVLTLLPVEPYHAPCLLAKTYVRRGDPFVGGSFGASLTATGTVRELACGARLAISSMTSRPYSLSRRLSRSVNWRGLMSIRQSEPVAWPFGARSGMAA